ncbi:MAG: transcriptional regulator [Myxococcales bacterium]|nr:transcriptional regulator [Myxococcales bacterium]
MTNDATNVVVTIIAEQALEPLLVRDLEKLGVAGYTITDARGCGHRGLRSSTSAEGGNIRCEVVCARRLAARILDHLELTYYEHYAMISFVTEIVVLSDNDA